MARQKSVLLRSAWKKGPGPFLRQAISTARDTFWAQRHFVYRLDLETLPEQAPPPAGLTSRDLLDWSELSQEAQARLMNEREAIGWGRPELFDEGYRLWAAELDGTLAALRWWKPGGPGTGFFIDIPADCALSYQASVMPEFRGRRLQEIGMGLFAARRRAEGVRALLASCRDYNATSRRMFARTGWTWLGWAEIPKRGSHAGQARWRPVPRPIPARELEGMS